MNFIARAFKRNMGPQPSVSSIAVDAQNVVTSNSNDRVDIRAGAFNRGGYAEATGLNDSSVSTLDGNDSVRIQADARGLSTNAWAMRNSTLNVGNGDDNVELRATTRAGAFDPAYGAEDSTINLGNGRDTLRINANARGNTTGTIAAYGTVNSQTNTGSGDDRVEIFASAVNRSGYAEAVGLDSSTLETENGNDIVRIQANARGLSTNAWAMRNSTLNVGNGDDTVELRATTRAGAFDPAYGALNSSLRLENGEDRLRIFAKADGNTTDTIAAFGTLNAQTNTGADNDRVEIRSTATNSRGIADAVAIDNSLLETESGDDLIRVSAGAFGKDTQAAGLRDSEANTGSGRDTLNINAEARGNSTDTVGAFGSVNSRTNTGADNDRVDIRATASNRGGTAEAVGLDASDLATEGGDDRIRIQANASGQYTYAWALRDSSLDAGSGTNFMNLSASTFAFGVDPAYGIDSSSVVAGADQDNLRISAKARGNTTGTIAAYGALNSDINLGDGDNKLEIDAKAFNRRGTALALGLDASTATTGSDDDLIRIRATANGRNSMAWAMRNSSLDAGAGDNNIEIEGNVLQSRIKTGDGFDTIRISGLETDQLQIDSGANDDVLKVDGGTRISYVSGEGSDQLQLTRNYFASLLRANNNEAESNEDAELKAEAAIAQVVEPNVIESVQLEDAVSGLNLRDALKFEDFTTGINGDSVNVDDILRRYGVGLKGQSIFTDGFLSFQQNGNDSVLLFDADGASQEAQGNTALVVFKGVQTSAFSSNNLDSVLINQDDFLLNQQQQAADVSGSEVETPIESPVLQATLDDQLTVDTNVDPVTGVGADQTVVNGVVQPLPMPAATPANEAITMGMETNQPLTSTPLDLATAGLEAPVTISALPELDASPAVSTTSVEASAENFNPMSASPSISGPDSGSALVIAAAPADVL